MSAYRITPPPHLRSADSAPRRLWTTSAALVPALGCFLFWFRWDAAKLIALSVVTALAAEFAGSFIFGKKTAFYNGSSVLIALLFSIAVPPDIPFWGAVLGSFAAVFFGKEIFGGLGTNLFHSALLGVCFLELSFPEWMNPHKEPFGTGTQGWTVSVLDFFLGSGGTSHPTSPAALLLGGLILIGKRLIDGTVPVIFLGTGFLFSKALGVEPWTFLLSNGTFLAAFFLITDSATTPMTQKGRWIFALGAALGTVLLRRESSYYNAAGFAVLLMNALAPWIDEWVRPRQAFPLKVEK